MPMIKMINKGIRAINKRRAAKSKFVRDEQGTIKGVKPMSDKKYSSFGFEKAKTPTDRANIVRKRYNIKQMEDASKQKKRIEKAKSEMKDAEKKLQRMVDTKRGKRLSMSKEVIGSYVPEKKAKGGMVGKNLKPVDKAKNPGLAKLPTKVRNKMGYMKDGGMVKNRAQIKGFGKARH